MTVADAGVALTRAEVGALIWMLLYAAALNVKVAAVDPFTNM